MVKEKSSRIAENYYIFLEDYEFSHGDLIDIHTNKRKEMINKIRANLSVSKCPENLKEELLDMAIVLHLRKGRYKNQDVDNIAKIVLDALEKSKDSDNFYLYKSDSQIIRLLIYKLEREEYPNAETSQLSISARKHNPDKEMILRELKYLGNNQGL